MFTYPYPRAALTVDAVVIAGAKGGERILLIQRGKEPFMGRWALPGGFVNMDETLEQACVRELYEETGLHLTSMAQFFTFDAINRDPRHRTISVVFYARVSEISNVKGQDDASAACWFPINDLPELAFDHQAIIRKFCEYNNIELL